ncbi:MAG TPA: DUF4097 family beta strand repeat-containing protein [Gemmatimonadaceae bacterium]|nr:DUF4097 family beta strand repeat-containing protein [Gemmatimonadaceae bacterium]
MLFDRFASRATVVAWVIAVLPTAACAQQTDTTVSVRPNARIQIQNFAGSVTVRAWDRNAVRVVASKTRRDEVRVRERDGSLAITTVSKTGVPAPLDYEISVPAKASLDIGGTYTDITIEGMRGSVSATTVQGAVSLTGGDGVISLKSVEGSVTVRDATGRIEVNGVNKGLLLRNVSGNIAAETVNGSIVLDDIQSADVEAVTVNGRVTYEGTIRDGGTYRFGTHNGAIIVSIPERANATVAAVTYQGTFSSRFALPSGAAQETTGPRRRANFAFGNGSARIEAESFQGSIMLARPGDVTARPKE